MVRKVAALLFTGLVLGMCATPAGAQSIVFASDRDGTYDIWRMNPDGTGQLKIGGSATLNDTAPAISPDGSKIAFVRSGDIWVMGSDGAAPALVATCAEDPAWSPDGSKLAVGVIGHGCRDDGLWTMNADGTDQFHVTFVDRDDLSPTWSPDGLKIAFHSQLNFEGKEDIWSVNADGTALTRLTDDGDAGLLADREPDWSPTGTKIAFDRDGSSIRVMDADGSNNVALSAAGAQPAWSPGAAQIAFASNRDGNWEIYKMNPDGSSQTRLTINAANDVQPDWSTLLPLGPGYARPKGATPTRVSLAIAYEPCTSPDRTHGPPLAFPSCSAPQQASDFLTVGTADANARPALNEGFLLLQTMPGSPATPADEADVGIQFFMDDVFTKPGLIDYTGALRVRAPLTVTDRNNQRSTGGSVGSVTNTTPVAVTTTNPHGLTSGRQVTLSGVSGAPCANATWTVTVTSGSSFTLDGSTACGNGVGGSWTSTETGVNATGQSFDLQFDAACASVPAAEEGSTCTLNTTVDSLIPGAVKESARAIWALGRVEVDDGGADGNGATADNTLLATQGLFIP